MSDEDDKPPCKYGINCYRRNEEHRERFSHPQKDRSNEREESNERHQSKSPSEHDDVDISPQAKRRKTVSSQGSDSDTDIDQNQSAENETTSNASRNKGHATMAKMSANLTVYERTITAENTAGTATKTLATTVRCSEFINANFDKGPHAQHIEYEKLLESPAQFIRTKFLVNMPTDFYEFWAFCQANTKADSKPENLFRVFGLSLVGPFDVLAKKFHDIEPFEPGEYLRHWRFYYDPPEFQVSKYNCDVNSILITE